jgi:hypothetical protein
MNTVNLIKLSFGVLINSFRNHKFIFKFSKSKNQIVSEIKKNGFYKIDNFLNQNICDTIINSIENFSDTNKSFVSSDNLNSDCRIYGSEYINDEIKNFNKNLFIKKIGEEYLDCEMECLMTLANCVNFKKNNEGSGGGWHRDSIYKQYKSILYLNDVTELNGPFQLIKNSNKFWWNIFNISSLNKKIFDTRFKNEEINYLIKNKNNKKITLFGKKGTLILIDTSMIHRGSPLKKNQRYALTNYFYPKKNISMYENHFNPRIKSYSQLHLKN